MALAGRVIASHYAEPLSRSIGTSSVLRGAASDVAPVIRELSSGEPFWVIDDSVGWAWGYAGKERRVGYVRSEALAAH